VGFAVDGAALFTAQARLQVAADAAAAAATRKLSSDASSEAVRVAGLNLPASTHGTVLAAGDVVTGRWTENGRSFAPGGSNPNAVRVITRYASANGNAHRLVFGAVLGMRDMDISATATAVCPSNPTLSEISSNSPSRIAVVTMGEACKPQSGLTGTCYWSTPQGNPIIRVDNWNPAETVISIRITSPSQYARVFSFTAPKAGQFWVVVPQITMNNAGQGAPLTNIVFKVEGSSPAVPANRISTTGTATYNNRFNATATLPGSPLCASANQSSRSRLVS
uniref:TadG family pilus assembly protein n=1 Tax=Sandarakinorhabdus oryzae TaxID=2675220 RepID=UPI0018CC0720